MKRCALLVILPLMLGCHSLGQALGVGRPDPVVFEFNDRKIEYVALESVEYPEDAEVARTGSQIRVDSDDALRINGQTLLVDDSVVTIGERQFHLQAGDKLVVERGGEVRVVPAPPPTAVEENEDSVTPQGTALAANSNKKTSWWSYLR